MIAFGRIHIVESEEERLIAATLLGEKFNPGDAVGLKKEIAKGLEHMLVFCLEIEHMSGKEAIELAKKCDDSIYDTAYTLDALWFGWIIWILLWIWTLPCFLILELLWLLVRGRALCS